MYLLGKWLWIVKACKPFNQSLALTVAVISTRKRKQERTDLLQQAVLNRISSLAVDVCLSAVLVCTRGVNRSDINCLAGRYSPEGLGFHSSVAGDSSIAGILRCVDWQIVTFRTNVVHSS